MGGADGPESDNLVSSDAQVRICLAINLMVHCLNKHTDKFILEER